jgi:hypothetical protein
VPDVQDVYRSATHNENDAIDMWSATYQKLANRFVELFGLPRDPMTGRHKTQLPNGVDHSVEPPIRSVR